MKYTPEWWAEDCPSRGPALSHAHSVYCSPEAHDGFDTGHLPFQCCHCRGLDPGAKAEELPKSDETIAQERRAAFWTQSCPNRPGLLPHARHRMWAKCLTCGMVPPAFEPPLSQQIPEPPPEEDATAHLDDELVEPKMITGEGPQGHPFGPGRGELTPRFEARLLSYDRYVQRRGELPGD